MKTGMKRWMMIALFSLVLGSGKAQSYEVQCLLLDCSKLAQLKSILSDMKKGYQILSQGYGAVKDISEDNFHLHQVFLDNLIKVSPVVQRYGKISILISDQLSLVKEYKDAWNRFAADKHFTPEELEYIGEVYGGLLKESLAKLDDLVTVLTPGTVRMSDDERLAQIDALADDMRDKLTFLRYFNGKASLLSLQRNRQQAEVNISRQLYGIK